MNFWISLFLSCIFLFTAIVVFATKALYPHHRILAIALYAIGWIPFIYSIILKKQWIIQHKNIATNYFSAYLAHIILGILLLAALYVFFVIFPVQKSFFINMDDKTLNEMISTDKTIISYIDKKLNSLLSSGEKLNLYNLDFKNISNYEKAELDKFWISYVEILLELDLLKDKYTYFYQISPIQKKSAHIAAFYNGYTALLAQHHYTLQLTQKITDEKITTYLNEANAEYGIDLNTFDFLKSKLTDADELLRMNAGRAYRKIIKDANNPLNSMVDKYLLAIEESLKSYSVLIGKKPLEFLEKKSFQLWFPIQKEATKNISYIRTASRDYHINANLINQYRERLLPGDILLERREWHATNIGIPGFWTHAALYISTLDEMNEFFKDLPELKGKSFIEYLKQKNPKLVEDLKTMDENQFKKSVIESKRPGVILMSLEESAHADSLGALRVKNLNKSDRLKIVLQAFEHYGKPYDFDFNFITDSALVCSELVYKAFIDISAVTLNLSDFNGRLILSPNQFAQKFDEEFDKKNRELELILFLDGNEKTGIAVEKPANEFRKTWQRPKWHIAKDFINL